MALVTKSFWPISAATVPFMLIVATLTLLIPAPRRAVGRPVTMSSYPSHSHEMLGLAVRKLLIRVVRSVPMLVTGTVSSFTVHFGHCFWISASNDEFSWIMFGKPLGTTAPMVADLLVVLARM